MRRPPQSIASGRGQRDSQRSGSLVACAFIAAFALSAVDLGAEERRVFYKYTDAAGQLHIVQTLDRVPPQYRNQLGEIALEGDPLWTRSAAQVPVLRPRAEFAPVERRTLGRNSSVVLYYADWCGYCKKARRWLDEHSVVYDLRDIDDARYADELREISGSTSIPVLSVDGKIVRGFRPEAYESALGS
jgi:glutaredoxin